MVMKERMRHLRVCSRLLSDRPAVLPNAARFYFIIILLNRSSFQRYPEHSKYYQTRIRNQSMTNSVAILTADLEPGLDPRHRSVVLHGQQMRVLLVAPRCLRRRYHPKSFLDNFLAAEWVDLVAVCLADRWVCPAAFSRPSCLRINISDLIYRCRL